MNSEQKFYEDFKYYEEKPIKQSNPFFEELNKIDLEQYKKIALGGFDLKIRKPVLILESSKEPVEQINTNWMDNEIN